VDRFRPVDNSPSRQQPGARGSSDPDVAFREACQSDSSCNAPTSQRIEAIASCSQILRKSVIDLCVTRDWAFPRDCYKSCDDHLRAPNNTPGAASDWL